VLCVYAFSSNSGCSNNTSSNNSIHNPNHGNATTTTTNPSSAPPPPPPPPPSSTDQTPHQDNNTVSPQNTTPLSVKEELSDHTVVNIPPDVDLRSSLNTKITLYQFDRCPFCRKVKACLDVHGLNYTVEVGETETRGRREQQQRGREEEA